VAQCDCVKTLRSFSVDSHTATQADSFGRAPSNNTGSRHRGVGHGLPDNRPRGSEVMSDFGNPRSERNMNLVC